MKKTYTILTSMVLSFLLLNVNEASAKAVTPKSSIDPNEANVIFKIHDIVPEKDVEGNVTSCNISVTFFNHYSKALSNTQISLTWEDEAIDDIINQEDHEQKEKLHRDPNAAAPRYPTSKTTSPIVSTIVKLPLINANQQISLKNKVNTDRCFLLLGDVDFKVNSCSFAGENSTDRNCRANFNYITPQDPQYFSEFKEISYEQEIAAVNDEIQRISDENDSTIENIKTTLRNIGN